MEISSFTNTVTITGNIKTINDFQSIKNALDILKSTNQSITLELLDSLSVTSSVIGYLNKLVLKDKIQLKVKIGNSQLMELMSDLNLIQVLGVSKIDK